ncbi:hypothetical protein HYDPIDRAFT_24600 [Hydnomerulius pinastri MD-312]|nr:hypothetical protein HYDPIDRAFT_24600 [Hydnomerulius pinastri MD-312]
MANVSLMCDSATSWYTFSYPLSWSNDCEVGELLSDIPFISVGILAFGVSVLFLVIRRVTLSAVGLYFSVFLAFSAAILDLGQTLAADMATSTSSSTIRPLIEAREVLFALSIGFRYLFYWSYVAEPPRKVLPATPAPEGNGMNFLILESSDELHSGSWIRWGLPGKLLRIGLLAAITAITALQIVWRTVPQFHRYSNIYATDTAIQLLSSVLLLLKLLLNTITPNTPDSTLTHSLGECVAPISALLINISLGVGNLLCFAFTESTVGRLLQAVELYINIIFVMVIAFLKYRSTLLATLTSVKTREFNITLPEPDRGSTFRVTPPVVATPRLSLIFGPSTSAGTTGTGRGTTTEALRRSARRSLTRVSSWVSSRVSRNRSAQEEDQERLWNQREAENGKMDPPYTNHPCLRASLVSLTEEPKEWAELVHDAAASHMSILSALDAQSAGTRSVEGSMSSGQILQAFRAEVAHRTPLRVRTSGLSAPAAPALSSDSHDEGLERAVIMTAPPDSRAQDSPIYGLGGIVRPPPPIPAINGSRDSGVSLDELLRQQSELDKSIAALKLFSKRSSGSSSSSQVNTPNSTELTRFSSSTGRRTTSDVSLSNFPVPPWLTSPMPSLPSSRSPSIMRMREDRRARLAAAAAPPTSSSEPLPLPPRIPASLADIPSSPHSDCIPDSPYRGDNESLSAAAGRPPRFNSGGTQYDVTSFIGGGHRNGSLEKPWQSTETEINLGEIINGANSRETTPRMLSVPLAPRHRLEGLPASPAKAKLSPLSISTSLSRADSLAEVPAQIMQRQINPQVLPSLTITPSETHLQVPPSKPRINKGMLGLPSRPKMIRDISQPKPLPPDGKADQAPRAFERPRPPPLVLQSYADYHPRESRVQDAGG